MPGTRYRLEVQPRLPESLCRLGELANDLKYTWDRRIRGLFYQLDHVLWEECSHNPKVFLRRVSQNRLEQAARDRVFLEEYNRVLSSFDSYYKEPMRPELQEHLNQDKDLVAYFCAEFGFHESMPLYSGGLGILAGDLVKAASDMHLPMVAVGILYRQGYFVQTVDAEGNQVAHYNPTDFDDLPIEPVRDEDGEEVRVPLPFPGREAWVRIWRARLGHVAVYLLDTDLPDNAEQDRAITYQLYGGDATVRIQQEIVLGIGGVRALRALGLRPTVWHVNEGHAAFQALERCREYVAQGQDLDTALERTANATVFTTHTPVSAGHDIFSPDLMGTYFGPYAEEELGTGMEWLLALGQDASQDGGFNMTALAMRTSRYQNGVSRIHGRVASEMEGYIWPEIPRGENPIGYVTNGVHVPTFLAREWVSFFDLHFGGQWRSELLNEGFWEGIDRIQDHSFWSVRHSLKAELFAEARQRLIHQHRRNGATQAQIERLTEQLHPDRTDVLTIGFARRFATYKRATLLFTDPDRLARLVNDARRPVLFLFAGKAHPSDQPGQHLIRVIHEFSRRPEFEGKIVLLEGYDMALARKLVTGVDVWLNTPEYPKEASGTSGQKAGINGGLNLSVLDGWWGEGYNGENGWAITPHDPEMSSDYRNREEAKELLELLEDQVVPKYYRRNGHGYSEEWVRMSKNAIKSQIPRFNAQRMLMDYVRDFYGPASRQQRRLARAGGEPAQDLARWKRRVDQAWDQVRVERLDDVREELTSGDSLPITVAVQLNGLSPEDVRVECLVGRADDLGDFEARERHGLVPLEEPGPDGATLFHLALEPTLPGLQYYKLRMYPYHPALAHLHETGHMRWL
ncbi:alpha-glucan phosphorylase [Thiohalorhabdus denitrificans]|uniref:Starch phosphorylase n=1 Tax=Thiohalorhabdus denitrificans TaxID=381306 RepID=A0A0P9GJ32_9GAMM|nr:alpha-glucan family phosphorylase [Thiohalorhabdus denitrificans]KPV40076.1 alpha-glucan phosphorylase [Thiohalorhabdus denitrificans]SCY14697.1 starch phosphorylase [Thiohalorhabdus denitrificans]